MDDLVQIVKGAHLAAATKDVIIGLRADVYSGRADAPPGIAAQLQILIQGQQQMQANIIQLQAQVNQMAGDIQTLRADVTHVMTTVDARASNYARGTFGGELVPVPVRQQAPHQLPAGFLNTRFASPQALADAYSTAELRGILLAYGVNVPGLRSNLSKATMIWRFLGGPMTKDV